MKKQLAFIGFLLFSLSFYAQTLLVTAENGLILREKPGKNSVKIGKIPFGGEVTLMEKTAVTDSISDNGSLISGSWVKVHFENFPYFISNEKSGYVFNGFLKEKNIVLKELEGKLKKLNEFSQFSIKEDAIPFYIKGDFFGDGVEDIAVLVKDSKNMVKIGIINYGKSTRVYFLGEKNDPFEIDDYNWVGIFEKVPEGEVLWSNYTDDFREFKEVPEKEKVRLNYDAIFVHQLEACGGGFIFWKNGKFNWLQQE